MQCHDCREKLLLSLDPSAPSTEVAAHVAECDDCRLYQQRLLHIESNVARIPVPPSRGPQACKDALRQLPAEPAATVPRPFSSRAGRRLEWIVAVLAASVLIAAVGLYWSMHRGGQPEQPIAKQPPGPGKVEQPKTFVAQLLDCNSSLAEGGSVRERVKNLALLTGLIQDAMASKPGEVPLRALVKLHHDTLFAGLLPIAQRLPQAERAETLTPIIEDLVRFHDEELAVLAPQDAGQEQVAQAAQVAQVEHDIRDIRQRLRNLLPAGATQAKAPAQRQPRIKVAVDWQRDLPLIEAIVTTGNKLALEENSRKRAELTHELAEKMGGDIKRATQTGDGPHAVEPTGKDKYRPANNKK